ncbi:D-alanyl-D-alanine carboxypeptidase, partial [Streptomyces sp. 15-116A]|nr:D-alanyl-D-alanine carboxypeptidase [Streptomyces sp. 15-116A]
MEEASVAGESPDRSKQRESSAGTTSGSAGPVPEARNGTEPRDPRLAVARETPSGARGKPDTATRVLSVRGVTGGDAPQGAEDAAPADAEPGNTGDTPEGPAEASAAGVGAGSAGGAHDEAADTSAPGERADSA